MKLLTFVSLAALATASPLLGDRLVAGKVVEGRAVTVTSGDLANLKFFAQYAGAAYCNANTAVGSPIACTNDVCPTVAADRAVVVTDFNSETITNLDGFIATDPARSLIVVSFRGSSSIRNWITNFLFLQQPCDLVSGCLVHAGFATAWAELKTSIMNGVAAAVAANPTYAIVVTGHSLGGAVGTLAAAYLRKAGYAVDLYTYGSPRVGNKAFVDFVTAQAGGEYRVTHLDDPVPRLPPILLNYRHTSPEYWLSTGTASTTDYGINDIKVCEGTANVQCNAGTLGLDVDAHGAYFEHISACGDEGLPFKDRKREDLSDAELEERLNMFAKLDQGYAAALNEDGLA